MAGMRERVTENETVKLSLCGSNPHRPSVETAPGTDYSTWVANQGF